jgi:nucleoside phosphorylase
MDISELNLIVFDEEENFEKTKDFLGYEGSTIKRLFCIQNDLQLKNIIDNQLVDDDYIFLVVHVFGKTPNLKGIKKFLATDIPDRYPHLEYVYISDGAKQDDIQHLMIDNDITPKKEVYKYSQVREGLKNGSFKPITKKELIENDINKAIIPRENLTSKNEKENRYQYAIFTALYDEFEPLDSFIDWDESKSINTGTTIYKVGKIKNTEKEVVGTWARKTGMIDAAILVTEMIHLFNPKYVIMPGVCGGEEKTNFRDIIVATDVFLLGKGKIKDVTEKDIEKKTNQKIELFYNGNDFNKYQLTDKEGKPVDIIIEKFEKENNSEESCSDIEYLIKPNSSKILEDLNRVYTDNEKINLHFEPMACSLSVIDKEDYFECNIKSIDRKTKAVEMESYGVARAVKLANGGKTKFIICKSVMDKTSNKVDGYKKPAANISVQFVKYILENDII